jgi:VWFA-related protein
MRTSTSWPSWLLVLTALALIIAGPRVQGQERPAGRGFSFKTGVELINVTATVTDGNGRFVPGLKREDFVVYEDGKPQVISQFDAERVPVSLGIALDTSGSMIGDKIAAARTALNRFLFDLLGPQDEMFLYRFDSLPDLVQPWTTDRQALSRALGAVQPRGGTALFDTVGEAVPLAQSGSRQKKALVLITDGNDTSSRSPLPQIQRLIRETEVLVYAIGIDASGLEPLHQAPSSAGEAPAVPSPFPGRKNTGRAPAPVPVQQPPHRPVPAGSTGGVDIATLRAITDDSGGRTEAIYASADLDPATARVADELSRQYFLGYVSSLPKDGRWHSIELQVRKGPYTVRARKGFIAN